MPRISDTLRVREAGRWTAVAGGVEYRRISLQRLEAGYIFDLKLFRFDIQSIAPRIVCSSHYRLPGADVKTLAERSGAITTINANYFDERGKALGFLKTAGQEINRHVSRSSLFTGVFATRKGWPFITHRDQFLPAEADEALQSGPLLLSAGRALHITRGDTRTSRRSVIGIDKRQRMIIGATDVLLGGLNWVELQALFSAPEWGLETLDLLNLDGGGSAQLYFKAGKLEEFIAGTSEVPVAIGFFVK
ncbi:MAG TPA: phosphodiester glycosidase family protein [Candidatus Eisenbacteria bacterium]|nr:phosphodiester glycosidase family protein [Candidatus Eisenbacteria bacterium]